MRIGLVGNGYWAQHTHAAGLRAEPAVDFVGLWGRDAAKTAAVAADLGVTGYDEVDAMFADIDAVAFSVPPQVQAELALRAARLGKHLLLEKPVATTATAAQALAAAVGEAGVASVVFFTGRFDAEQRGWLAEVSQHTDWDGGTGLWLGSAFAEGSPFDTPWRHELGGLWDVGPHALAMSTGALGPIVDITARGGHRDVVQLILQHAGGAVTSYALSIDTAAAAAQNSLTLWGPAGLSQLPAGPGDAALALATAARELAASAQAERPQHPCDVAFGASVVALLERAQAQLDAAR